MSSIPSPSMNPSRSELRARRRALDPALRSRFAMQAARLAKRQPFFLRAERIAFYLASDGELDPLPLLRSAVAMGKQCLLPVLHPLGHRRLWFARWKPGEPLRPNRYGIPEPRWERSGLLSPRAIDLVLMPLVAFDHRCHRMGMGAGYYDRTFAWRMRSPTWRGPSLVGYAYALQGVTAIDTQPWDVPLDAVITEREVLRCK